MTVGEPGPRFARAHARATAALQWERWAPALLPAAMLLAGFMALALLGLWEALGDPWRALALIGVLAGGAWLTWRRLRASAPVSAEAALRRVEQDSGLEGRPFEALTDAPAARASDPVLWRAHVARMTARVAGARAGRPRAALAAADTRALRAGLIVILVLAFAVAGPRATARLGDAFLPGLLERGGALPQVDAWVQPPAYTGAAPVFLTAGQEPDAEFAVPAGSELTVRVTGVRRAPGARVADDDGRHRLRFETLEGQTHEAKAILTGDSVLSVNRAGRWTIRAGADTAPTAAFAPAPASKDNHLTLGWRIADDYGVTALILLLEREGETDEIPLNLAGVNPREEEAEREIDLTSHRWAGERVQMTLRAADAIDQHGLSETVEARIPQRIFLHSLARAVAEQRQLLLNATEPYADLTERPTLDAADTPEFADEEPERRIERAPEGVRLAADMLGATLIGAERYFDDPPVWLGLVTARGTLQRGRDQDAIADVPDLLWDIAMRVESGGLADAEAALRAAERALMEALARGADAGELAQLFDAFQQAMNRYLEALAREAVEQGRVTQVDPNDSMAPQGLDMGSVQDLLDAIREASELGDEAGARAALAALTEMLRNMEMEIQMGGGGGQPPRDTPESRAMRDALSELSDMINDQRQLMDETLQQGGGDPADQGEQQGQQSAQGGQPGGEGGQSQQGQSGQPGGQQGEQAGQQGQPGAQAGQQGQGGRQNQGQGLNPSELAGRQAGLADRLDQLGEQQGEGARGGAAGGDPGDSPGGEEAGMLLDRAREAMREAENRLRQGDAQGALDAQDRALQALREGARQMANSARDQNGRAAQDGEGQDRAFDPLGRMSGGTAGPGDGVAVPDEMERQRARDILDELRRRSGERRRPALELDYLRRLLERF